MTKKFIPFLLLIIFTFLFQNHVKASHLAGGDFKVTMLNNGSSSSTYDVQLRLYRDDVNGISLPTQVTIGIYQIGTNNLVTCKTLYQTSASLVPLGDPCYTPDPNVVRIEEKVYQTISAVTLPNFTFGYYLQYDVCCRNQLATNLATPTSDGITIFAIIPNPGLGQNSTPDFGNYPNDAYFCVNNIKQFTYPVTDPDGDQLVYSLVAPLDEGAGFGTCSNSAPGSGTYPFYPDCVFSPGFNATNMIGGPPNYPAMSIDASTGEITSAPTQQGFYAFAVRVEEYRNGIKIGEVRRELQYAALPCQISIPPTLTLNDSSAVSSTQNINTDSVSVGVYVDDSICLDLEIGVNDPSDSLYALLVSSDFDLLNTYVAPIPFNVLSPNNSCNYIFNMYDSFGDGWNGASVDISVNGIISHSNIGSSFTTGSSASHNLVVSNGDIISIPSGNWTSGSWDSEISWDIQDHNGTVIASGCHPSSFSCVYNPPVITVTCPSSSTTHAYANWNNSGDSLFFNISPLTPSGFIGNLGNIYLRYCWMPPCNFLGDTLQLDLDAYSVDCSGYNPIEADIYVHVDPVPQSTSIDVPSLVTISLDDTMCIDLFAQDTLNPDDTLYIQPFSGNFDFQGTYVVPQQDLSGGYYYENFNDSVGNTVYMYGYNYDSSTNIVYADSSTVALRYCWVTDCDYIFQEKFDLLYTAYSSVCGSDTIQASSHVEVEMPVGVVEETPNTFTPNGDGENDFYQLAGQNDPCFDMMNVNIYNRWGKLVFTSDDPNFRWDGTNLRGRKCDTGSYLVIIDGTFGSTYDANGVRQPNPVKDEIMIYLFR